MERKLADWHHAPLHLFVPNQVYMVTGGTLHKQHFYLGRDRLELLKSALMTVLALRGWELRVWALFSNHYHFIAKAPPQNGHVHRLIQHIHSDSARALNRMDGTPGRKVWYQYWDTCITFEKSYYPRLHYILKNAVHHRLVSAANQYSFCSAAHMEKTCSRAFQKRIESFKYERLNEPDDYIPLASP